MKPKNASIVMLVGDVDFFGGEALVETWAGAPRPPCWQRRHDRLRLCESEGTLEGTKLLEDVCPDTTPHSPSIEPAAQVRQLDVVFVAGRQLACASQRGASVSCTFLALIRSASNPLRKLSQPRLLTI